MFTAKATRDTRLIVIPTIHYLKHLASEFQEHVNLLNQLPVFSELSHSQDVIVQENVLEEEKNPQLPFCCKWWIYTVMGYMKKRYQNRIQNLTNMFNNEHCFKSACALDRNFEMLSVIGIDFSNVNTSDPLAYLTYTFVYSESNT